MSSSSSSSSSSSTTLFVSAVSYDEIETGICMDFVSDCSNIPFFLVFPPMSCSSFYEIDTHNNKIMCRDSELGELCESSGIYCPGYPVIENLSWDYCGEFRDIYTTGEFDVLGNFTWDIHSDLGNKIGCYLRVGMGSITDALNEIADKVNVSITSITDFTINLPGNIWDSFVNGIDSALISYVGISLQDVLDLLKLGILFVISSIITLVVGLLVIYPAMIGISTFIIQSFFIIMSFGDKSLTSSWDKIGKYIKLNVRWLMFWFGVAFYPFEMVVKAIFGGRWESISRTLIMLGLKGF